MKFTYKNNKSIALLNKIRHPEKFVPISSELDFSIYGCAIEIDYILNRSLKILNDGNVFYFTDAALVEVDQMDFSWVKKAQFLSGMGIFLIYDFIFLFEIECTEIINNLFVFVLDQDGWLIGVETLINTINIKLSSDLLKDVPLGIVAAKFHCFLKNKETNTVFTNGKSRQTVNGQKFTNETNVPITYVDKTYHTTIIRDTPFPVQGHYATRLCGPGRTEKRQVWIDSFKKNGYHRRAKVLRE